MSSNVNKAPSTESAKVGIFNAFGDYKEYDNTYSTTLEMLLEHFPTGFDTTVHIYLQGEEVTELFYDDDTDITGKNVLVVVQPQSFVVAFLAKLITWKLVAGFIFSTALSYLVGKLFAPKSPNFQIKEQEKAKSAYNLNNQNNIAQRGGAIPVIYGEATLYPSLVCNPHYYYEDNKQYMNCLYMIGHNNIELLDIFVGDTSSELISSDILLFKWIKNPETLDLHTLDPSDKFDNLIKKVEAANNIELKAVADTGYYSSFSGNVLSVWRTPNGVFPEWNVNSGESFIIKDGPNAGTYYAGDNNNTPHTIEVQCFTDQGLSSPANFTLYPDESYQTIGDYNHDIWFDNHSITLVDYDNDDYQDIGQGVKEIQGTSSNDGTHFLTDKQSYSYSYYAVTDEQVGEIQIRNSAIYTKIDANKAFGPFSLDNYVLNNYRRLQHLQFDFVFPNGLYHQENDGSTSSATVDLEVKVYGDDTLIWSHTYSYTRNDTSPIRITEFALQNTSAEKIHVYVQRKTPATSTTTVDTVYLEALNGLYNMYDLPLGEGEGYTYLYVKLKASEAFSTQAQGQIKVRCWSKTESLSDVIKDVYTSWYGGQGNETDLILPNTDDVQVSGVLDQRITVQDALELVSESQGYLIYPIGNQMKLREDYEQNTKAIFDETNIIADSMTLSYSFNDEDHDSIEVQYRDRDFLPAVYRYPSYGVRPQKVELFGVSQARAEYQAELIYNKQFSRNRQIEFKTDIQGYIPQYMDRIAVSTIAYTTDKERLNSGEVFSRGDLSGDTFTPNPAGEWFRIFRQSWLYNQTHDSTGGGDFCADPLECNDVIPCTPTPILGKIMFRLPDSSVTPLYTISESKMIQTDQNTYEADFWLYVKISGVPAEVQDGIFWNMFESKEITDDYLIAEISTEPDQSTENSIINIKAVSYSDIYPPRPSEEGGLINKIKGD